MEPAEEKGASGVQEAELAVSPASATATASPSPRSTLSEYTTPRLLSSADEDDRSLAARARSTQAARSSQAAAALATVTSAALTSAAASAAAASARSSTVPEFSSAPSRSQTATATPSAAGAPRSTYTPIATPPQTSRFEKIVQPAAKVAGLPARRVSVPTRPLQPPEPSAAAASVLPKAAAVSLTGSTPTTKRKSITVPPELAPPSYATVVTESISSSTSELHPFSRSIRAFGSTSALSARRSLRTLNSEQYNPLPAAANAPVERAGFQRVDVEPAATAPKSAFGVRSRRSSQRSGSPHAIAAASAPEPPPLPPPVPPVSRPVVAQSREYNWSESDGEEATSRRAPRKERHERDVVDADADEDDEEATSESSSRSDDSTPAEEDERQRVSDAEIELFQKLWKRGGAPLDRSSSLRARMGAEVAAEVQSLLSRKSSTRSWPKRAHPHQTAAPPPRAQRPEVHMAVGSGEELEPRDVRRSPMNTSLVRNPHASHVRRGASEDRSRPERRARVGERVQSESPVRAGRQRLDFETLLAMSPVIATPATGRSDRVTFIMRELVVKYLSERQLLAEIFALEPPAIEPPPQTLLETFSQMRATANESLSRWYESASELFAGSVYGAGGGKGGAAGAKHPNAEASEQSETHSSEQELDAENDAGAERHTSRGHRRAHTRRAGSSHRRAKSREKTRQKRSSSRREAERRSESSKRNPFCDVYYGIFDDFEAEFDFDKLAVLLASCSIVLIYM